MRRNQLISLALLAPSCQAYVWPSKYDQLDDLLYLQSGYIRNGELSDRTYPHSPFYPPCNLHNNRGPDLLIRRSSTRHPKGRRMGTNELPRRRHPRCLNGDRRLGRLDSIRTRQNRESWCRVEQHLIRYGQFSQHPKLRSRRFGLVIGHVRGSLR